MVKLTLKDLVEYGIWFAKTFDEEMGLCSDTNIFDTEQANVAVQKIFNKGLAVVPCNPEEHFIETPYFVEDNETRS